MKVLAIFIVTFCAASSFAKNIQFQKDSQLPKELQTLVAQYIAYNCSNLVKSNWTISEDKTEVSNSDKYEVDYETSATITKYDSNDSHPTYAPMYIQTAIYKGESSVVSIKSNGICNSVDN